MSTTSPGNRNLAMEVVRITEVAALAASRHMGKGDEMAADRAAVEATQGALTVLDVDGAIAIGEAPDGDNAPLFAGQKVGNGHGPKVEVALRPLEGATVTARGGHEALSVVAMAEEGGFLKVPPIYMDKIAVGPGLPEGVIDLRRSPSENLHALAQAKGVDIQDLVVCILDRPRHAELIAMVRAAGSRILLISDGDVSGVVATVRPGSGIDIYLGIGGAAQGVLAAAALACARGQMQGKLVFRNDDDRRLARDMGISDLNRIYPLGDMARGDVTFAATGVTDGAILNGVRFMRGGAVTHSLVMRSRTGTVRYIEAHHDFVAFPKLRFPPP